MAIFKRVIYMQSKLVLMIFLKMFINLQLLWYKVMAKGAFKIVAVKNV